MFIASSSREEFEMTTSDMVMYFAIGCIIGALAEILILYGRGF